MAALGGAGSWAAGLPPAAWRGADPRQESGDRLQRSIGTHDTPRRLFRRVAPEGAHSYDCHEERERERGRERKREIESLRTSNFQLVRATIRPILANREAPLIHDASRPSAEKTM